jgi:hypothetical protein
MLFGSRVRHWGNRNIETEVVAGQLRENRQFLQLRALLWRPPRTSRCRLKRLISR